MMRQVSIFVVALCALAVSALRAEEISFYQDGRQVTVQLAGQDGRGGAVVITAPAERGRDGKLIPAQSSTLTSGLLVRVTPGTDVNALANGLGVQKLQSFSYAPGYHLLEAGDALAAVRIANHLVEQGKVISAEPQLARQQQTRDVPNDALFPNQWHLRNTGQSGGLVGADANVVPWWNFAGNSRLGAGVNIAIVDDGLQHTHPDLQANYQPSLSTDINGGDSDPSPTGTNNHGTAVAGVAAAVGNNTIGVSGAAPRAGLSGIRLIAAGTTDTQEANGLTFQNNNQGGLGTNHIYSNSWGPSDNGSTLAGPGTITRAAMANAVANGRGGRGSIFTWAGGNGGDADHANYDGYANSRYVIAVAASTNGGVRSSYSELGTNIFVTAPSSGGSLGITTTDRTGGPGYTSGDYTSTFGGTSSATPLVSGAIALMLEANPNLGWRDVKHILARTSTQNDAGDSMWVTNAAGRRHNDKYGFGRINAAAAAQLAQTWVNVGPELSTSGSASPGVAIPDGSGTSSPVFGSAVSSAINITGQLFIETVEVIVNVSHTWRGDLEFTLTAPTGTQSVLARTRNDSGDNYSNWSFTSVKHWDELSQGLWTLSVRDGFAQDTGTFNSWTLNVFGTTVPEPAAASMLFAAAALLMHRRRRAA